MGATASKAAILGGCDFVKTSTGKVKVNATLEAARVMLQAIADHQKESPDARKIGFKAAGGVRDVTQARQYLELTAEILLGDAQRHADIGASSLRFGASSLLPSLRSCCGSGQKVGNGTSSGY